MSKAARVLLLSASVGSGHTRAAQAVSQALRTMDGRISTEVANLFHYVNPTVGHAVLNTYLYIIHHFPVLYKWLYSWGNASRWAVGGRNILNGYLARKIKLFVKYYQPSIIVCTHASPAGAVAHLKRHGLINVPAAAVVTDFVVHRLWLYQEMDAYFVANEDMRHYLISHGIEAAKVIVSGIPIDQAFAVARAAGTDAGETPAILLMGGGAGVLPMTEIVAALDSLPHSFQLMAVTGNNTNLWEKLSRQQGQYRHPVEVFRYIHNVHELMRRAAFIITKPGGLTSSEALAMGLPLLIYRPIPGQEEANTRYLTSRGAAVRADDINTVARWTEHLLTHQASLEAMRAQARAEGKPRAAACIAAQLISMLASQNMG